MQLGFKVKKSLSYEGNVEYRIAEGYEFYQGDLHREDGPAVILDTGEKRWYLKGFQYTEKDWTIEMRKCKLEELGI